MLIFAVHRNSAHIQETLGNVSSGYEVRGAGVVLHLNLNRFLRTFGASESAYTFCEPADEVLPAHHNVIFDYCCTVCVTDAELSAMFESP